ncbi:Protein of unknown function [Cotesia congregata]|uniref:Uncharacterized protein n=1 Tax=Cotesia congregata TaxID=51543 RepID=A0A8J2HQB4_COTCN|nr:Protein of unknown function [Cotesia congregata]
MDLLTSFYLCRESDSGDLIIYNYNPFINYAPYPWRSTETTSQEMAGEGTLFHQHFNNDSFAETVKKGYLKALASVTICTVIHNYFAFGVSLLDVFSLIFNMGIMTPLDRLSMRIVFVIASFFIFLASSAVQSKISALLARPSRYSIDTLQNLFDHRYHVFYYPDLHQDISDQNIWVTDDDKKFLHPCEYPELFKCTKNAGKNSTIACIYK